MNKHKVLIIQNTTNSSQDLVNSLNRFGYELMLLNYKETRIKQKIEKFSPDILLINTQNSSIQEYLFWSKQLINEERPCIVCIEENSLQLFHYFKSIDTCGFFVRPSSYINLHLLIMNSIEKFNHSKLQEEHLCNLQNNHENLKKLLFGKEIVKNKKIYLEENLYFNTKSCETYFQNKRLCLTKKENLFIQLLVSNIGQPVNFEQVIECIWGKDKAIENSVRTLVWRLRSKLYYDIIKTVSGVGYYLERYETIQNKKVSTVKAPYNNIRNSA